MEFSWGAFGITLGFWLAQAILSDMEGTVSLRQLLGRKINVNFHGRYRWQHLPMSFLNNWTVSIGDLFIFPIINALVVPYLWLISGWQWKCLAYFVAGTAISVIFHRAWWGHDENLGHVFVGWSIDFTAETRVDVGHNNFYDDMTQAGWVHFWFMAAQVAVVLASIFTPMPREVVFGTSALLSAFFIIQNVQGVLIQEGFWPKHFFIAAVELSAVWAIAIVKMTMV